MNNLQSHSAYRWIVLGIVMMGTFMAILDSSIVNVALPHMMSAFGVNRDQIEWVATAFMLATAVSMPLVGWLVHRFGHKSLYLGSLAVFVFGSALCAFSWSYDSLIVARVIQAFGGGAIQPVSMAIVAELFEPSERGKALGIWGTGIMVGPAIGPTLGGYLTDWFNWRTIFTVNLPIGAITLLFGLLVMRTDRSESNVRRPFDLWGFIWLSVALIGGLLAMSEGQEKGWDSALIRVCLGMAVAGFVMFLAIESGHRHPLLNLRLFLYRNFTISMLLAIFRAVGLFGGVFLMPLFLENLVGYTTIQTGLWLMPMALTVGITMPVAGRMADRFNARWLVSAGTLATGMSLLIYGHLDPLSGPAMIIVPQILRGVGLALLMAPLLTVAINAVPHEEVATASSFLNISQRLGGAFGIAFLNTYVTNSIHRHAVGLGENLSLQTQAFQRFALASGGAVIKDAQGTLVTPQVKSLLFAGQAIGHRASVLGFENGFVLAGLIVLAGLPLCFLLNSTRAHARGGPHAAPPVPAESAE